MATNTKTLFPKNKQARSQNTLNDLLEAANQLITNADSKQFTARSLAQKSGYALGTLIARLKSVENIFILVIENQREKHIQEIVQSIKNFDRNKSIQELGQLLIEKIFVTIPEVNVKVIQYIERRLINKKQPSFKYFHYSDPIAKAYIKNQKRNATNTFRRVTEKEAILIFRSLCLIIERPFVEEDPIAGSREHRRIASENFVRLLGK